MNVKSLRIKRNWSQEQLARLSGLNVRTIQRIEKGQSVGFETLKSLAAVFEVDASELQISNIKDNSDSDTTEQPIAVDQSSTQTSDNVQKEKAKSEAQQKVRSIRQLYGLCFLLVLTWLFLFLPNYNGGENLGPLIVSAISFAITIGAYALVIFQPFGAKWEQKKYNSI